MSDMDTRERTSCPAFCTRREPLVRVSCLRHWPGTTTRNPRPDQAKVAVETSQGFGKVGDIGIGIRYSIEGPRPAPTAKASGKTD